MNTSNLWKKSVTGLFALFLIAAPAAVGVADDVAGDVEIDEWFNPLGLDEVIGRLQVLEWAWTEFEGETEQETMRVRYALVGMEEIQGQATDVVELTVDGELWRIWLAADGSVAQAEIGGELWPPMLADMVVGPMVMAVFWPFQMVDFYGVEGALTDAGPGWDFRSVAVGEAHVGELTVPVQQVSLSMGEPHLAPGEQVDLLWEIADFGPFQMLITWQSTDIVGDDVMTLHMRVEKVVLR